MSQHQTRRIWIWYIFIYIIEYNLTYIIFSAQVVLLLQEMHAKQAAWYGLGIGCLVHRNRSWCVHHHIISHLCISILGCLFRYQPLWGQKLLPWNLPRKKPPGVRISWSFHGPAGGCPEDGGKPQRSPGIRSCAIKWKRNSTKTQWPSQGAASLMSSRVCSVKNIEYEYWKGLTKS